MSLGGGIIGGLIGANSSNSSSNGGIANAFASSSVPHEEHTQIRSQNPSAAILLAANGPAEANLNVPSTFQPRSIEIVPVIVICTAPIGSALPHTRIRIEACSGATNVLSRTVESTKTSQEKRIAKIHLN
jgi:hypothetical protein